MEIVIAFFMFLIGTFLGSFFTLAIHRLPLKQNITHERSYCPNCNHKLGFFDLFPIFSYLFLGGKCRYCGKKIARKYLYIELASGIVFLLFYLSFQMDWMWIEIDKLVALFFGIIFISTLILIAGIDQEKHEIQKNVIVVGLCISLCYILYLSIIEQISIDRYAIYLGLLLLFVLMDTLYLKRKGKSNYTIQILMLCMYLMLGVTPRIFVLAVIITFLCVAIKTSVLKFQKEKVENTMVPFGFYLCISSIVLMIIQNFLIYSI